MSTQAYRDNNKAKISKSNAKNYKKHKKARLAKANKRNKLIRENKYIQALK